MHPTSLAIGPRRIVLNISLFLPYIYSPGSPEFGATYILCFTFDIFFVVFHAVCWTYLHHCQIGDKNPSKGWNGGFRGFRTCVGWISTTGFCVVGFMCTINFSLFSGYHAECYNAPPLFPATTPRATTPTAP